MWRKPLTAVVLVLATFVVYWPLGQSSFLNFDDPTYVTNNPVVLMGLSFKGFLWAFTSLHGCNWHPVTWLSHMLDCTVFGKSPAGPHLVNVALHAVNSLLLLGLLQRITGAFWRSALVAGLFALHPLHVESVAWVAERKDVLSTFFFLLTLWAYARYAETKSRVESPSVERSCRPSALDARPSTRVPWSPSSILHVLSSCPPVLCPGPDEQADAGDAALRPIAPGLLATAAVPTQPSTLNPQLTTPPAP